MGSLGLHRRLSYVTTAIGIGGTPTTHNWVILTLRTSAIKASKMIRDTAATSGIPLAVARNTLPASYVKRHAAIGGLKYAAQVGRILLLEISRGLPHLLQRLSHHMGGRILSQGRVTSATLTDTHGFTIGQILISDQRGEDYQVAVCNEYLAFQQKELSVAAFPDLITLFDFDSSLPLASSEVKPGMRVAVLGVPRVRLRLGSTMKDEALLRPIERLLKVKLAGIGMQLAPGPLARSDRNGRRA
jgi:hypothetical protein